MLVCTFQRFVYGSDMEAPETPHEIRCRPFVVQYQVLFVACLVPTFIADDFCYAVATFLEDDSVRRRRCRHQP